MTGRLLLVRHGETEWSASGRHTGRTDVPLTPTGEAQARALAGPLGAYRPVRTLTSPRARATHTARLAGCRDVETLDDLVEWDYGDYEGLTREEIRRRDPQWTVWTTPSPGGETAEQVLARADRVLDTLGSDLARGDVLLVSHGHFSRVLAVRWLELPLTAAAVLHLATASLCVLGDDRGIPVIQHWNIPNARGATPPVDPPTPSQPPDLG